MKIVNLEELLGYKNEYVIQRAMVDYGYSKGQAEMYFQELLKFFWLGSILKNNSNPENIKVAMYPEMKNLDNLWHTFLIFTVDYFAFCNKFFGHYIHHQPNISNTIKNTDEFLVELEAFLNFAHEHLGNDTLKNWFAPCFDIPRPSD